MSLNKVQLIGNVGKDPDVRYLDNGVAVATFPLATTDRARQMKASSKRWDSTACIRSTKCR